MEALTIQQIRDFVIVLLALMAGVVLLGNVIRTIKEWGKPMSIEKDWRKSVNDQLTDQGERIETLEEGNKHIITALVAMLSHEINGNSIDKLRAALDNLNQYLIDK